MPFWRRRKALHEELAEGTGLLEWQPRHELPGPRAFAGTLDVLHGGRQREWEAVASAEAPGLPGSELEFTALPDGTLLVEEELPEDGITPLGEAVEQTIQPPYRAVAVRREGDLWGVAANRIDVVELAEDVAGDTVSLAIQGGERTLLVDDAPAWDSIPALEAFGTARHDEFVLQAERLDGRLWAVKVNPL